MRMKIYCSLAALAFVCSTSCENLDGPWNYPETSDGPGLSEIAAVLAEIQISKEQLGEVHDAVSASRGNGYDEEYTMGDIFRRPGRGVGDPDTKAAAREYATPLRELLLEALENSAAEALEESDIQIYWPYSETWDGETFPVITFDPEDGSETNIGYEIAVGEDGERILREIVVTEEMAMERPVWVINRNDDSGWTTLEMLIKNNPAWSEGGGTIIVSKPAGTAEVATKAAGTAAACQAQTKAGTTGQALILKDFTMLRHYDPWFCGASEFFCKIGCIDDFNARTEAELKLYSPLITDFMLIVRRKEINMKKEVNAMLMTNWTDQLSECALMIVEDDGGTRTTWSCSGTVKIASKSYGFDVSIPLNERDDIVWRGNLSYDYLQASRGKETRFGDVKITFDVQEY